MADDIEITMETTEGEKKGWREKFKSWREKAPERRAARLDRRGARRAEQLEDIQQKTALAEAKQGLQRTQLASKNERLNYDTRRFKLQQAREKSRPSFGGSPFGGMSQPSGPARLQGDPLRGIFGAPPAAPKRAARKRKPARKKASRAPSGYVIIGGKAYKKG